MIVVNNKMHMTLSEVNDYIKNLLPISDDLIICPSSIYIPYFVSKGFNVGIQNVYLCDDGAYTGEVSPKQAKSVGVSYAIIGHAERRKLFNESDYMINQKIKCSLQNGLNVILCVGEDEGEDYREVIKKQLSLDLENVKGHVIISYESIWAIGSKQAASCERIIEVIHYIKSFFDYDVKVLYGGSVDESSIYLLKDVSELSGFMIGSSSIDYNELIKIREVL